MTADSGDGSSAGSRRCLSSIRTGVPGAVGRRLQQCDHCPHQDVVFQSCRNRACPKCQSGAREKWLATTAQELLPAPYSHVTFTLPHQLCGLALQNPRLVYGMLFQAASQTLLTLAARGKSRGEAIKQVEVEVFRHRMDHGDGNTEGSRATRAVMVIGDRDPCECRTSILRAAERTPGRQRV